MWTDWEAAASAGLVTALSTATKGICHALSEDQRLTEGSRGGPRQAEQADWQPAFFSKSLAVGGGEGRTTRREGSVNRAPFFSNQNCSFHTVK